MAISLVSYFFVLLFATLFAFGFSFVRFPDMSKSLRRRIALALLGLLMMVLACVGGIYTVQYAIGVEPEDLSLTVVSAEEDWRPKATSVGGIPPMQGFCLTVEELPGEELWIGGKHQFYPGQKIAVTVFRTGGEIRRTYLRE